MRRQAERYGATIKSGTIARLQKQHERFAASTADTELVADRIMLSTGIKDLSPEFPGLEPAVRQGVVRYCPVCDGYEATDLRVAIYGPWPEAAVKAVFLRTYTRDVTVLLDSDSREWSLTEVDHRGSMWRTSRRRNSPGAKEALRPYWPMVPSLSSKYSILR